MHACARLALMGAFIGATGGCSLVVGTSCLSGGLEGGEDATSESDAREPTADAGSDSVAAAAETRP